ncbi:collagen-like protein [Spongiivirga citrea]|uniref:Collagen-like protein n=1 Tax=Spongiivirga citrea TaxID=1481457 RepID=A0A6M0CS28_9FLAO|nr:collagen-like protein [Spongiivirga citrea]NER18699.1 hypothetical protein [Spongiivirga citrea]
MKTTLLKLKYVFIASIAILALSCNTEDGVDGLDGAPGIQGEQGPAGQDGADGQDGENGQDGQDGTDGQDGEDGTNGTDGQDGEDGNANVIASDWFGPDGQSQTTNGYTTYAEFERDIENVDPNIINTGTLIVYAKFDNFASEVWPTDYVSPLPLTISGGTTDHYFTHYFSNTTLKIRYRTDPRPEFISFSTSSRFRYVIIPAGTATGKGKQPDFSKMTYVEVMDYLKLDY